MTKEIELTDEEVKEILRKQGLPFDKWRVTAIEEDGKRIAVIEPHDAVTATSPTARVVPLS